MRIAFYAPMKSPRHPHPSGDRRIARLLINSLQKLGHELELVSELRTWEGQGDPGVQRNIKSRSRDEAQRIVQAIRSRPPDEWPDIWFSYHLYHKAPDWIGPRVCAELGIPYIVAEASYAPRQVQGNWADGLKQVQHALDLATAILCLNPRDIPALQSLPGIEQKLHRMPPFLDTSGIACINREDARKQLNHDYKLDPGLPCLVSIAMMREDAKLESYRLLAETLLKVTSPCQLLLIGDGKARQQVESLFDSPFKHSVRFTGQLGHAEILRLLTACDLFVWPAVNEAIGMAILEAQACALPVVAGASGAIPDIILQGQTGFLCAPEDSLKMASLIDKLLTTPHLRQDFSAAARENINKNHGLEFAAKLLDRVLHTA